MSDVREVKVRLVPDGRDGLVAYASCIYHGVGLNDIAVRRDAHGALFLTFPRKVSSTGHPHPIHWPLSREVAAEFERAIVGQLRRLAGITSDTETAQTTNEKSHP
jgi:DNA-binding cell septation regulator SpoVG